MATNVNDESTNLSKSSEPFWSFGSRVYSEFGGSGRKRLRIDDNHTRKSVSTIRVLQHTSGSSCFHKLMHFYFSSVEFRTLSVEVSVLRVLQHRTTSTGVFLKVEITRTFWIFASTFEHDCFYTAISVVPFLKNLLLLFVFTKEIFFKFQPTYRRLVVTTNQLAFI